MSNSRNRYHRVVSLAILPTVKWVRFLVFDVLVGLVDAFRAILSLACGDMNADGKINLADITRLIDHVYLSKAPLPLPCYDYEYGPWH